MVKDGRYGNVNYPLVPLSDGAGEVEAVGEGVTRWKVGDRVAGCFFQGWQTGPYRKEVAGTALGGALSGMLAEYVVLRETGLVSIPKHLSFEEAATLPCAGVTAWHSLVTLGRVSASDTVLVLGTGGVSIFALQFAKMHGARVIVTSSSEEKLARARSFGADETINYVAKPDWEKEVFRLTGKAGVNHVVEVGGAGTLVKSLKSLAYGGHIYLVGGVSGFKSELPIIDIIGKMANLHGMYVGSQEMFEAMNRAIAQHQMHPVVDHIFTFDLSAEAYNQLGSGGHFGKIVVTV
jgi:NADPH:quinone reductase-like Zn-dependent oxidoreductase